MAQTIYADSQSDWWIWRERWVLTHSVRIPPLTTSSLFLGNTSLFLGNTSLADIAERRFGRSAVIAKIDAELAAAHEATRP
jgi:hypothetical protein